MKKNINIFISRFLVTILLLLSLTSMSAQTVDSDGDGIVDQLDLDDDNDGIPDTVECPVVNIFANFGPSTVTNTNSTTTNITEITFGAVTGNLTVINYGTESSSRPSKSTQDMSTAGVFTPIGTSSQSTITEVLTTYNATSNFTRYTLTLSSPAESITLHVASFDYMRTRFTGNHREQLLSGGSELIYNSTTRQLYDSAPNTVLQPTRDGFGSIKITSTNGLPLTQIVFEKFDDPNSENTFDGFHYSFSIEPACDLDGDGIPNRLDLDSDGDGCFDAIEGDENVQLNQLNSNGSINTANNGGVGTTTGTNRGIPNLVNSGGAADIGGDVGQGLGDSQNNLVSSQCIDTDGDGVQDVFDLDDDNDGILDTLECIPTYIVRPIVTSSVTANKPITSGTASQIADGEGSGGTAAGPFPYWYTNVSNLPIAFSMNLQSASTIDHVKLYGPWGFNEWIRNFTIELYNSSNTLLGTESFTTPNQYTGTPIFKFTTEYTSVTRVRFTIVNSQGYSNVTPPRASINEIVFLDLLPLTCDTDGDGIPNHLDLDSDNDGCLDALEGDENISPSQLVNATSGLSVGLGSTAENKNLCATSTCVDASGVPTIVNTGGAGDIGGDQGQGIGDSQNALVNGCICYENPSLVTGQNYPVKHGITALSRAGADSGNWPMIRNSAYTALESKTKGFVITRNSSPETTITIPVVGMVVFDTDENAGKGCLKIYTGSAAGEGWKCYTTPACP